MPLFDITLKNSNIRRHRVTPEEQALNNINWEILQSGHYDDIDDLPEQLELYKAKYLAFKRDANGNIGLVGLKKMLEECGQPKTHLELKTMIREVDKTNTGTVCYRDCITLMCGPGNSVIKIYRPRYIMYHPMSDEPPMPTTVQNLILRFEQREAARNRRPIGPPPKRDLSSLP